MDERRTNLLKETEEALKNHNFTFKNVKYILNKEGYISIADFISSAQTLNYYDGYGGIVVDPTLKIVGACWWFERYNYDGNEGWIFCKKPQKPSLPATDFNLTAQRSHFDEDTIYRIEKSEDKKVS